MMQPGENNENPNFRPNLTKNLVLDQTQVPLKFQLPFFFFKNLAPSVTTYGQLSSCTISEKKIQS